MATALIKDQPLKAEELERLSETSLAFVKEALSLEENGLESSALLHYEEGLRLLDRALAIDLNQNETTTEMSEDTYLKQEILKESAITKTKMSRTRQQVIFRIHELRIKANAESRDPPPSYEDSQKKNPSNRNAIKKTPANDNENTTDKMNTNVDNNLETTIKIDDDETIVPLPSDAEILFTIAGRVQIFYISADGNVSAPTYPSTLFIFKFKNAQENATGEQDPAFLQVGTWVYPLVKGKSPVLKSKESAYMFPDLDDSLVGNAIGLILPNDILDVEKQEFEAILQNLTKADQDLKQYEECLEYSEQVSEGLKKGAEYVGRGMVKGAIKSSEWMYLGAEKVKDRINPELEDRQVDPRLKQSLSAARWVSSHTVKASGYLVSKAGDASLALGRFLAPHIRHHGAKALSHIIEQSDDKSQKQMDIASELAGGTLTALGTVYSALENSSRILATNVANNTVQVLSHKYGTEVGTVTENALTAVGNTYMTAYNTTALGPKSLAKRAVKTTGKAAVGVSDDVILGRTVAPSSGEETNQNQKEKSGKPDKNDTTNTDDITTTNKSLEQYKPD